jgi:hypothetical protein
VIPPKQNRAPRDLQNAARWDLSKLPSPWRVANLYVPTEPVKLQLGKKDGCTLQIIESPLPNGDRTSEEYWSSLWYARTELPSKGPLRIRHGALKLPEGIESTVVQSPSWTPVYCWIVLASESWHVEVRTESNRGDGDLTQVSALIARLGRGQM